MKTGKIKCLAGVPVLLFIVSFLPAKIAVAQNIQAEPKNHEFRVYKDLESNKLYWPKDLPVYVWLSTSDDPSSPKHRLEEASIRNEEGAEELDQSRIDLELSGNQYIRWFNYETGDTLMLQFQADGILPTSVINLNGANSFNVNQTQYYGKNLKAGFRAEDNHSGVENIYISVNGAEFSPYFNTFDFNQEKEYFVSWYAVDHVGNVEPVNSTSFVVDLNAPVTRHQINGSHQGSILAGTATINLISEDALSGLKQVHYHFDNVSEETAFSGGIPVSSLGEGTHTLFYRGTDQVGNTENVNQFQFYLDKTSPVTELIVEGDQYESDRFYVSERTQFQIQSSDNKTGIRTTYSKISDETESEYSGGTFVLPSSAGGYSISYRSVDNVGNQETEKTRDFILDTQPPSTSHSFTGQFYTQRGITWIPTSTHLELSATDDASGVQQIFYSIDKDVQNALFDKAVEFQNEGRYVIEYWSKDQVNNVEHSNSVTLIVDNTPPDIIANYSSSKIGSSTAGDGSVLDQYPVNTVMYLAATDEASGAGEVWITVNGNDEQPFSGPVTFAETGEQNITIRSVDRVGNELTETLRFIISE